MTASPQTQATSVLCGAANVSQTLTDEVATHESRTGLHCNQVESHLASQELPLWIVAPLRSSPQLDAWDGWATVDTCPNKLLDGPTSGQDRAADLTHSHIPDRQNLPDVPSNKDTEAQLRNGEVARDVLRDLPSAVLERGIAGSDIVSSGSDATDDNVLEESNRSAEADSVPPESSIMRVREQKCEDDADIASSSTQERGPDAMITGFSDQGYVTQRFAGVQHTTETSGDDPLGFKGREPRTW